MRERAEQVKGRDRDRIDPGHGTRVEAVVPTRLRESGDMLMADTQQRIRVFCVDDHRVMLDGLALLIGRQPDMEVVGSATHGEQAVDSVARISPTSR
jgi:hypothetical protein